MSPGPHGVSPKSLMCRGRRSGRLLTSARFPPGRTTFWRIYARGQLATARFLFARSVFQFPRAFLFFCFFPLPLFCDRAWLLRDLEVR